MTVSVETVTQAANETGVASPQVLAAASELSRRSERLIPVAFDRDRSKASAARAAARSRARQRPIAEESMFPAIGISAEVSGFLATVQAA